MNDSAAETTGRPNLLGADRETRHLWRTLDRLGARLNAGEIGPFHYLALGVGFVLINFLRLLRVGHFRR